MSKPIAILSHTRLGTPTGTNSARDPGRRLGIAVQGVGGAVATTAAAGLALLRGGHIDTTGLPLARLEHDRPEILGPLGLARYEHILVAGWDLYDADLLSAARQHGVLPADQLNLVAQELADSRPWPAIASKHFRSDALAGGNILSCATHRDAIERICADLQRFRGEARLDALVLVNLSSTEAPPPSSDCFTTIAALERALDASDERISPSVLYAYAAIQSGVPHVNFTPTRATDWPAMIELAQRHGVPVCGKDGKTGQTLLKTVLAPAFRDRHLRVQGWFSTNLLGNRDGAVLADPQALQSKLATKTDVLAAILGYPVEHQVHIHYYKPRGDAKESWDSIDLVGFANQHMQLKLDFLCRDSILAAPLAIELARLADLAQLAGCTGPVAELGVFFKSPISQQGAPVEHGFARQQAAFEEWLRQPSRLRR